MSGHSKWAKIKRAKGLNDAKKGALFTKLAKNISLAASEAGGDIDMNFALRLAVDKAKAANMPSDNIARAIKKGTGELDGGVKMTKVSYEAYGPESVGMIIDCTSDNTNRAHAEIKNLVESYNGKMAEAGSVSWQFKELGSILIEPKILKKSEKFGGADTFENVDKDELVLELMEIPGVIDISESSEEDDDGNVITLLEITTDKNEFAQVDKALRSKNLKINSSELAKIADNLVEISESSREKLDQLIESLEESSDIDNIWHAAL